MCNCEKVGLYIQYIYPGLQPNELTKFGDLALAGRGPASEGSAPGGSAGGRRVDCGNSLCVLLTFLLALMIVINEYILHPLFRRSAGIIIK